MLTVKWSIFISREALGGSLESFPPANWQLGAETAQPFSKIKLPRPPKIAHFASSRSRGRGLSLVKIAKAVVARPRVLVHFAVALGLVGIVAGSSLNQLGVASLQARTGGYGSALDQISTTTLAAEIAQKANFMAATDAVKQADTLSSQVALPTASDTVLAKREVVETAGSERRTIRNYSAAPGDTVSGIAAKFGVTTDTIKWANHLSDVDTLAPGTELTILPITGLLYRVQSGDTASSIADKFQANAAQIISFNNAEIKGLQVGQRIVVPDGVQADAAPAPASTYSNSPAPALTAYYGAGNGYDFGYCTWYVASRRSVPSNWGNAANWYYNAQFSGFKVGDTPRAGAIAWTGAGYAGHVAYVESVHGGMVTVSEMNYGGWDQVTYRTVPSSYFRYIY